MQRDRFLLGAFRAVVTSGVNASRILFAVVLLTLLGLSSHATYAGSGDEPHYLAIAHSLAFDVDLDLSNNYGPAEPLIADGGLESGGHILRGVDGVMRPIHDVGLPLLLVPVVRVIAPAVLWLSPRVPAPLMKRLRLTPAGLYRHLLGALMALVGAWLACVLRDALLKAGASPRAAFLTALLVALSPPLLIYAILLFTELVSALLCLLAFRRLALDRDTSTAGWLVAGAAAGLLLLVHARNVGIVAGLVLLAAVRLSREGSRVRIVAFAGPLALMVAVRTAVIHRAWGTFVTTPIASPGSWRGLGNLAHVTLVRLAGLLVDQEFGLLPYAPVFAIALVGIVALWRTDRPLARSLGIVAGGYLLAVVLPLTNPIGWTGGWCPAARFMTPIVPLLALGLVRGFAVVPRPLVIGVLALQVALDCYFWQYPKNLWNDNDGQAAICQRGGLRGCGYLPSFVTRSGPGSPE
ncbi:MAG TPA: hypothetical protein VF921_17355 [Vicinamibacterales bacterium]